VEGGKTDAEKIGRTAKIKHTQNKQRKKIQEKPKPKNRENKQNTKYNGKQNKNREIKRQMINRRGSNKIWPEAPLRKVAMGERRGGDAHMTCHRQRGYENADIRKTKARKKAKTQEKKKGRGKKKKKGRDTKTRASSK
jgi:hypothetical protein